MRERRFVKGASIRAKQGDKPGIEGYGAVFGDTYVLYEDSSWRFVETIKPGAFARVLQASPDTRCLFNHDPDNVLGRTTNKTLRMKEDDKGLQYENDFDMRTTVAQNVSAFVDRGDVTGCSFAFTVSKQSWTEEKADGGMTITTRTIEEVGELYDVGPVTYPAYEGTSVGARSAAELRSLAKSIEGLPAEIRAHIDRAAGDDDESDEKCSCRCVACARDNNCEKCVDYMVDCGDEKNCRCMSKRSKKRDTIGGGIDCQCACPECQVGDCANCSDLDCEDPDCDHSGDDDRAALIEMDARMRQAGLKTTA